MSMLEPHQYCPDWAQRTIIDIACHILGMDLLNRAAVAGVKVNFTYDWFEGNRVKRVTVSIRTGDGPFVELGSASRLDGEPFNTALKELFEQVRRQLLLIL